MAGRILVCDDEPYIQHAVRMKLAKSGYEVEVAADGQAGLEAIEREVPALLITDLQMPRMDGLELCRILRSNPKTYNLPVIMLTAKGFEIDASGVAKMLRLSEVMFKPFSPRELLQAAEKAIAEGAPAASTPTEDLAAIAAHPESGPAGA